MNKHSQFVKICSCLSRFDYKAEINGHTGQVEWYGTSRYKYNNKPGGRLLMLMGMVAEKPRSSHHRRNVVSFSKEHI
jgi:hypothetical protein